MNYYEKQFKDLKANEYQRINVKFIDFNGNQTKWLTLTQKQFNVIKDLMIKDEQDEQTKAGVK